MKKNFISIVVAAFCGLLLNLAYAPYECLLCLFLVFPIVYSLVLNAHSVRFAAIIGYVFSFSYLAWNISWISNALGIDESFYWLTPIALVAIPFYMAIYPTICFIILRINKQCNWMMRLSIFSLAWVLCEYLRSLGSFGFSMNQIGYVVAASQSLSQMAALIGIYGLGCFVIFFSSMPAEIYWLSRRTNTCHALVYAGVGCFAVCCASLWGKNIQQPVDLDYSVKMRIVQGGMTPFQLWRTQYMQNALIARYLDLSMRDGYEQITHFIWGEGTLPMAIDVNTSNLSKLVNTLPPSSYLLTGSSRIDRRDVFNSWFAIESVTGAIKAHYDKSQLVPFGEFMPFRGLLGDLFSGGLLNGIHDYSKGHSETSIISIKNTPDFHVMICYETMFMDLALKTLSNNKNKQPKWILNITNDGWFGHSSGAYQHLAVSKIRAIETGLPFIRSANTGISVVFDGYGRVMSSIPLGEASIMDVYLPKHVRKTLLTRIYMYLRYSWALAVVIVLSSVVYSLIITKQGSKLAD